MQGAWLTLQQDEPDDYVLASGIGHTVAELADAAFAHVGLDARDYIRVDRDARPAARGNPAGRRRDPSARPARVAAGGRPSSSWSTGWSMRISSRFSGDPGSSRRAFAVRIRVDGRRGRSARGRAAP